MTIEKADIRGRNDGTSTLFVDTGHNGDTGYTTAAGISLASASYTPTNPMHGLLLTDNAGGNAAGNIDVTYEGGGRLIIPCAVLAGYHLEILSGHCIKTLNMTTTTFTGRIYPLF